MPHGLGGGAADFSGTPRRSTIPAMAIPSPEHPPSAEPSFEESLSALERVVHDLEQGQLDLSTALARYEEGIRHLKHCYQILEQAEQRVEWLTGLAADGKALTEPWEEDTPPPEESVGRRRKARRGQRGS